MCNYQEIENEFHFLMVCPTYNNHRANLFNSIAVSHEINTMTTEEIFTFTLLRCVKKSSQINVFFLGKGKSILYN